MKLSEKTALVTGAGRGIGRGCAVELAKAGAEVVINDRPGSTDLMETAELIRQLGGTCHPFHADVFCREQCEELVARALEATSQLDILVSNPAYSRREPFLTCSPDLFIDTINGTLTSGFHMSQLVARHMAERGAGGRIVFISSVQAEMPIQHCFAYGAAKAGLNHMMRSLAVELAPHRINVNVIAPGWIDTPNEHVTFGTEALQRIAAELPLGRLGTPEDIGQAAVFLSSDDSSYVSGVVLQVDGLYRFKDCAVEPLKPRPKE